MEHLNAFFVYHNECLQNTPNKQKANKQKRPPPLKKKPIKPHAELISETIEETIHFRGEKIVLCNTSVTREIHSYQRSARALRSSVLCGTCSGHEHGVSVL